MKNKSWRLSLILLTLLTTSGCQLGTWEDFRNPPSLHHLKSVETQSISFTLAEKISFKFQKGERDVLGGCSNFTISPGTYSLYGESVKGKFFKGTSPCIIRSGNLGHKEDGGFYIPNGADHRVAIWLMPQKSGAVFIGAGTIYSHNPDYASQAILLAWMPSEHIHFFRPEADLLLTRQNP